MMRAKLFLAGYALCQLDAFEFAGAPLPWLGLLLCMGASLQGRLMPFPGLLVGFAVLMLLTALTTVFSSAGHLSAGYVTLRFLNLLAFLLIVNYVAVHCRDRVFAAKFAHSVINVGVATAAVALIVYALHVANMGDLPRNRMGTSGLDQPILFTFEVGDLTNRALGTFREPSFLAMALVLPLALAYEHRRRKALIAIGLALYFSFSVGVLLALPTALLVSASFAFGLRRQALGILGAAILVTAIGWLVAQAQPDNAFVQRVEHLLNVDLTETSRGYIYENLPLLYDNLLFGSGVGYVQFTLASILGSDLPVSVSNLLLSTLGSGGLAALVITTVWLLAPNFMVSARRRTIDHRVAFSRLVPLNAYLVLYVTTFEELHVWHAVALGLLLGLLARARRRHPKVLPDQALPARTAVAS